MISYTPMNSAKFVRFISQSYTHKRMSDEALLAHIRAIHSEVKGEYGWPKMWKELIVRGHRVGKERIRLLMQLHGILAKCKRKFVVTTDSKHHLPIAPNLVLILPLFSGLLKPPIMRTSCLAAGPQTESPS